MNRSDDDIKEFFAEMRKVDQKITVPILDDMKKSQPQNRAYLLPIGVAASLLIMVSTYLFYQQRTAQPEPMELIITLGDPHAINTQQLITRESTIDAWESPTSSLIEDF